MNALDALKLARETGCRVRPKGIYNRDDIWIIWDSARPSDVSADFPSFMLVGPVEDGGNRRIDCHDFKAYELIGYDGSEVLWEEVKE